VPLAGQIADLDSAYRYACALAQADILPQDLRGKPSNVLMVLLYGQYLNIPPVIATQVISVVKGRPQIAGKMLLAKVREAGHKPRIVHGENKCTVTITRGDDGTDHTEEFTLADAVAAKLCSIKDGKPYARSKNGEPLPWENHTKQLLMWRAVGHCVDIICPEVKMGFGVQGEDVADDARPSLSQVAAERADRQAAYHEIEAPKPPEVDDAATAAEIADIQAKHTEPTTTEQLSYDEAMEAEMLAYEAQQAGTSAEDGQP
jgi:hypothetical protein